MRVLRINHSAVVTAWRQRERELHALGTDVELVSAARWEEGGGPVDLEPDGDEFVVGAKTLGRHPNLFLFDPRPLWSALGDPSVDIVDIHEEPFSLAMGEILLIKALRRNHAPYVVYSAQNLDKTYPWPFSAIERWSLTNAAAAHVCNEEAGQRLRDRGLRGEAALLALGVDLEQFTPLDRPPPSGGLRVGFVGRLAVHKGVLDLVEAVAPCDDWTLEMVGDGPDREAVIRRATELGMGDRLLVRGHADQAALAAYYQGFDVLAVPSIPTPRWTEQFGRVAVEAMASGVPVVTSDGGALPEVVGSAGLVVRAGDVAGIRGALRGLCDDPGQWRALRAAGLDRAEQFTWAAVARQQRDLYGRVAPRRGGA